MKTHLTKTALLAALIATQTGCGFNRMPECSDRDVETTLRELMMEQSMPILVPLAERQNKDINWSSLSHLGLRGFSQLEAEAEKNPVAAQAFRAVQQVFDEMFSPLRDIRTTRIDKEVRKVWCEAQVDMNMLGNRTSAPVVYSAQITDDGRIYVEHIE